MSAPQFDERLWFKHIGCEGQHFVLGNPHTFPGRMLGWCCAKERIFFFSKYEVGESSAEAAAWIDGFLAGNEPEPPTNAQREVDFESSEYKRWLADMERFRASGKLGGPEEQDDA